MSAKQQSLLTPRQRFTRGLKYTALGPVDMSRGAVGVGVGSARSSAAWVGDCYRRGQLGKELAAAQEVVGNLPQALQEARRPQRRPKRRRRRPLIFVGVGVVVLAGGAVAFSIIRRPPQPEPSSARPPSIEVVPKP